MKYALDVLSTHMQACIDANDHDAIERTGRLMDWLEGLGPQASTAATLGASALWYAGQGLPIFPLIPGRKKPIRGRGFYDATTDSDQIRQWWGANPSYNIGVATGHVVDLIDIDGAQGIRSWARLINLPPVIGVATSTRPGGIHLWTPTKSDVRCSVKKLPGIDYRGVGGYLIAPPSTLVDAFKPDGAFEQHAGTYQWRMPPNLALRQELPA